MVAALPRIRNRVAGIAGAYGRVVSPVKALAVPVRLLRTGRGALFERRGPAPEKAFRRPAIVVRLARKPCHRHRARVARSW